MLDFRNPGLLGLMLLVLLASPAAAFGAGNVASTSKVAGQNWRHGDIEDALLSLVMAQALKGKKFSKIQVSRVYFGNWLRDYSQAIDVGTVKAVSAEAIRLLLCILGFLTFGFGSGEFEITADRLGCYRPEDHIDNPKNYADNKDAKQYDERLRGPIDEQRELSIDPRTGMKNYIANDQEDIMTSSKHVRKLFSGCIELGRRYKENHNKPDKYEALRLMGTGLHCLEDFFAHSNYTELALIEMGEKDVFPHCGRKTRIELEGAREPVYPIVTGTFGGVDFLHSVVGEVSDKLTQNEIDELEGTLKESQNADTSLLRDLLDKLPDGLFGGKNQKDRVDELQNNASVAQVQNMAVSPRNPEQFTVYVGEIYQQIMPVIQFHDDVMKTVTGAVEKIPLLPKIIEQLEEQLTKFVFSIVAPLVVPLIHQIRNELRTGSEEIVHSSQQEQHIVFDDDGSTDPTHSMLSKDHFSNILNEIAGRTAAKTLHWVVPQLMKAMDDTSTDVNRLLDRIVNGVMHHPAQREMGQDGVQDARKLIFESVTEWWEEIGDGQRNDYRKKLSREGVFKGENHKEGVQDTGHGHGCSGKLKMRKLYGEPDTLENRIAGAAAGAIFTGATGVISGIVEQKTGYKLPSTHSSQKAEEGGEGKGGFGGFISSIMGGSFGKEDGEKPSSQQQGGEGPFTQTTTETGKQHGRYGQGANTETQRPDGSSESSYSRFEQQDGGGHSSGYGSQRIETRPSYGGGHQQRVGRQDYQDSNNEGYGSGSGRHGRHGGNQDSYGGGRRNDDDDDGYGGGRNEGGHGGGRRNEDDDGYGGGRNEGGYGGGYGGRDQEGYGGGGHGRRGGGNGRRDDSGYGGGYGGGNGRRDDSDYGGGYGGGNGQYGGGYGGGNGQYGGGHGGRRGDDDDDDEYGGGYGGGSHGRGQGRGHGRSEYQDEY
ncbi:hypothetical protein CDD82_2476 [Ophiocordyceps australis]|uniref:Het-C-domain-containing protein n=1 Tax=Ophiocordyceps australis TaxID=1399860 RepID=A0A2C5ZJB6_9HYPO|nr:hypothetical protein CDD82_2476 [Ophiocordyceps australis]